jgi:hypothetical protein
MRKALLLLVVGLVAACGGDNGPSGPSDSNVGGTWHVMFSNMSGSGVTCVTLQAGNLSLTQNGGTFTGTYGPVTLSCTNGGETASDLFQGMIVNGTVDEDNVRFDLDTQDFHQVGTVSGNSMSGTARWEFDVGGGQTVVLNGSWSASKQ